MVDIGRWNWWKRCSIPSCTQSDNGKAGAPRMLLNGEWPNDLHLGGSWCCSTTLRWSFRRQVLYWYPQRQGKRQYPFLPSFMISHSRSNSTHYLHSTQPSTKRQTRWYPRHVRCVVAIIILLYTWSRKIAILPCACGSSPISLRIVPKTCWAINNSYSIWRIE